MAHREEATVRRRTGGPGARSGGVLLGGTLASNLLSYAFFVVLSRRLDGGGLGAVGSLVNLSVLAGVPALGLQLVGARLVAHSHPVRAPSATLDLLRFSCRLGLVVTVLLALASPALAAVLDVDVSLVVALALAMTPIALVFTCQGLLQGSERFVLLAVVLTASGLAKFVAAWASPWTGGGVTGVIVILVTGWVVVAAFALTVVRLALGPVARKGSSEPAPRDSTHLSRMVAAAVVPTSGLLFLSSVDVLLARVHLSPAASGTYTVGALFEKAAFWGLGFLATLFYPAMARPGDRRAALRRAVALTAATGTAGVGVAAALGAPLVTVVGGTGYAETGPLVWRFTLLGVCLALVQLLAYAGLAASSHRMGLAMWVAGAVAVGATALHHEDIGSLLDAVLAVAAVLVAVGVALEWRSLGLRERGSL